MAPYLLMCIHGFAPTGLYAYVYMLARLHARMPACGRRDMEVWKAWRRGGPYARVWTHVGVKARRNLRGLISRSDWEMRSPRFEK